MSWLLFFLVLVILLVISVLFLELFDVSVPDLPLSYFSSQVVGNRRAGSCSSFFNGGVDSLDLSVLVVKLVLHGLLYSFNILA